MDLCWICADIQLFHAMYIKYIIYEINAYFVDFYFFSTDIYYGKQLLENHNH